MTDVAEIDDGLFGIHLDDFDSNFDEDIADRRADPISPPPHLLKLTAFPTISVTSPKQPKRSGKPRKRMKTLAKVPSNAEEITRELRLMRQREYDAKSLKKKRFKKRMLILELAMLEEAAFVIVARKLLEQTTNPAFFCCYDARRDSQCPVRLMDIVRSFISSWGRLATIRAVAAESAALSPRWEFYCQLDAVVTELETQNWGALSDL